MNQQPLSWNERIEGCLARQDRLTMGEIGVLTAIRAQRGKGGAPTFVEEQELQGIERKLGLA